MFVFFFSSRRRHTRFDCDWSSDVCSSDLVITPSVQILPSSLGAKQAWWTTFPSRERVHPTLDATLPQHIQRPAARAVPFHAGSSHSRQKAPPGRGAPPAQPHLLAVVQSRIALSRSLESLQLPLPLLYSRNFHFATEARKRPHPGKPPTCSRQKSVPRIESWFERPVGWRARTVLLFRRFRQGPRRSVTSVF